MIDQPKLLFIAILYIGLLFIVAWQADNRKKWLQNARPLIYSLALGVYCSSWTFFGAVGQASSSLWSYVPIYLGPMLTFIFAYPFLQKLLSVGEQQKVTSIADFIGSRYGKNQTLSALVTLLAIAGSLPYIALQLRAVSMAWETLSPQVELSTVSYITDTTFIAAIIMCVFAILFGTRNLEGRERNRGMVMSIALESIIKLVAFFAIALFAIWLLFNEIENVQSLPLEWTQPSINLNFITQTILASLAIICLPRQFHILVVEYQTPQDLRVARWSFPLYLLLFSLLIIPIAFAGHTLFSNTNINPDSLALSLPVLGGSNIISTLAFLGGLSAATGMVIVASITLAVMISNEIIAPLWLKLSNESSISVLSLGDNLKLIRRVSITLLLFLAWLVNKAFSNIAGLAEIGLLSFAACAQLAPLIIIGLYWRRGHRNGAIAGLSAGYLIWFYCMIYPVLFPNSTILQTGPWQLNWLLPESLFYLSFPDSLSHGVFWSLLANISLYLGVSWFSRHKQADANQAKAFVSNAAFSEASQSNTKEEPLSTITVQQLQGLMTPFIGVKRLKVIWKSYEHKYNQHLLADDFVPFFIVDEAEKSLSGVIGSATANKVIKLLHKKQPIQLEDIAELVGDTSQKLRFSQNILETTVETVSQAISVIDNELRLVAWNTHYQKLFNYPDHLFYIGCPIAKLFHINAERGLYGDDLENTEEEVNKRLDALRRGEAHHFERKLPSGRIIDVRSNPMPEGGFVTSYTDITEYRKILDDLEETKATLEDRVAARTEDLSRVNNALKDENRKRAQAEKNLKKLDSEKSRFLAHTSHDLMQPLNAAHLFVEVMRKKLVSANQTDLKEDLSNIDHSLNNAEVLVSALREISYLDKGNLKPDIKPFQLMEVMESLVAEFQLSIESKGLDFHYIPSSAIIVSDINLLRRILQNFLSNALKYTKRGRIVIGCRRRKSQLEIQVFDTGIGVPTTDMNLIFDEFVRLSNINEELQRGLGLGLSIAKRSADLLNHPIKLLSKEGVGSMFSVLVPTSTNKPVKLNPSQSLNNPAEENILNLKVICIDNDNAVLTAMNQLLTSWGCEVFTANSYAGALTSIQAGSNPDLILLDYHLDQNTNGIDCWLAITELLEKQLPTILISADSSDSIRSKTDKYNIKFLEKPVKPAALLNIIRIISAK